MNDQDFGTSVKKKLKIYVLIYFDLVKEKIIEKGHSAVLMESIWRTGCLVGGNSMLLAIFIFYFESILYFP